MDYFFVREKKFDIINKSNEFRFAFDIKVIFSFLNDCAAFKMVMML